jgi:hypothetical protein
MLHLRAGLQRPLLVMVGDWHVATVGVARSTLCRLPFVIRFIIRHVRSATRHCE